MTSPLLFTCKSQLRDAEDVLKVDEKIDWQLYYDAMSDLVNQAVGSSCLVVMGQDGPVWYPREHLIQPPLKYSTGYSLSLSTLVTDN